MHLKTHMLFAEAASRAAGLIETETEAFVKGNCAPDEERALVAEMHNIVGDWQEALGSNLNWGVEHGPQAYSRFEQCMGMALKTGAYDRAKALDLMGRAAHYVLDLGTPFHTISAQDIVSKVSQAITKGANPMECITAGVNYATMAMGQFHSEYELIVYELVERERDALFATFRDIPLQPWSYEELVARTKELEHYAKYLLDVMMNTLQIEDLGNLGFLRFPRLNVDVIDGSYRGILGRVLKIFTGMLSILAQSK